MKPKLIGRVPMRELRRLQVDRLQRQVELLELENDKLRADCLRLWLAIQRIDGINDNPTDFNAGIDAVIRALQ